jgi:hypothetical protein
VQAGQEYLEFVHLPSYVNSAKGVIGEAEQRALESTLIENPVAGAVMAGTGGVRKVRVALGNRGKSAGARVIYYFRASKGRIYLLVAYGKNERANITRAEANVIRQLVSILEAEP